MARKKVTVVGAGNVGATAAQRLFERGYMDVVLVDVVEDMPQGKALDIAQSGPVLGVDATITGSNGYEETADSDVVVITAGIARRPGMSRDDLLFTNMKIVGSVVSEVAPRSPNAVIVVVSNPLDAMVQHAYSIASGMGFPKNRVVGMAGVLDTARFRTFLAWELGVSVKDVQAYVLGGHGDQMVPLTQYTTVGGVSISKLLDAEALDRIIKRTQGGGGEIVTLLKTGSAYYAPSAASAEMVDAILLDQKRLLPCAALLEGEYGIDGIYMGVPVILGAGGVERVVELDLTDDEKALLDKSADAVRELVDVMANAPAG
ncbi:MAG: malate dehydrogenase [Chloroflexota bacterium]|nr:malate dehydrogenase [Chloroflexota bacterium]MDE2886478.1 malate dehydrogenase [Chloroflexota bacterium]